MKNTKFLSFMLIFTLAATLSITPAFSVPDQANSKAKEMTTVSIPQNAKEIGPGVYDLGVQFHNGKLVQGTMFVFTDKEFAKPSGTPGNGKGGGGGSGDGDKESTCFSYITKGAKWRAEEPWTVSLDRSPSFDVTTILVNAVNQWETVDDPANAIMGSFDSSLPVIADSIGKTMDGANEVAFGDITDEGVIAATWVWRTVSGPPQARYIAEWDQLYDTNSYTWSNIGASASMDFGNIATHEIGHAVGMGHPDSACTEETMYAYADYGETKKRSLHAGDIAGVNGLY